MLKRQRPFLDFGERHAHQTFKTTVYFSGGCKFATTINVGLFNR